MHLPFFSAVPPWHRGSSWGYGAKREGRGRARRLRPDHGAGFPTFPQLRADEGAAPWKWWKTPASWTLRAPWTREMPSGLHRRSRDCSDVARGGPEGFGRGNGGYRGCLSARCDPRAPRTARYAGAAGIEADDREAGSRARTVPWWHRSSSWGHVLEMPCGVSGRSRAGPGPGRGRRRARQTRGMQRTASAWASALASEPQRARLRQPAPPSALRPSSQQRPASRGASAPGRQPPRCGTACPPEQLARRARHRRPGARRRAGPPSL